MRADQCARHQVPEDCIGPEAAEYRHDRDRRDQEDQDVGQIMGIGHQGFIRSAGWG